MKGMRMMTVEEVDISTWNQIDHEVEVETQNNIKTEFDYLSEVFNLIIKW